MQKLFPGDGYVVGGAGAMIVIQRLFRFLLDEQPTADSVLEKIREFLRLHVVEGMHGSVTLLVVRRTEVVSITPSVFLTPETGKGFAAIGSGADFVYRALGRDGALGLQLPMKTLAEMLVAAEGLAVVADESLTVDDRFMIGFVRNEKSYLLADRGITLDAAPDALRASWSKAVTHYEEIRAILSATRAEEAWAFEALSSLRNGTLNATHFATAMSASAGIRTNLNALSAKLDDYFSWYDQELGRP